MPPMPGAGVAADVVVLRHRGTAVLDQADLRRRAAHVEGEDVGAARASRRGSADAITPAAGPDSTMKTGRTRGRVGAEDAAARLHHEQLRLHARRRRAGSRSPAGSARTTGRMTALMTVVDARRYSRNSGATSEESETGTPGQLLGEDLAHPPLVLGVHVGVEEADGDRLDALAPQDRGGLAHGAVLERRAAPRPSGRAARRRRRRGRAARAASPSRTACRRAWAAPAARSRAGRGTRRS